MPNRARCRSNILAVAALLGLAFLVTAPRPAEAGNFKLPEVFLLGDSQFAFGAGPTFFDFFRNFSDNCGAYSNENWLVDYVDGLDVGVMGVRSTSIHSWVARTWKYKKFVCEPDPKWQVNARLYGWANRRNGTYVQLGRAPDFQICRKDQSAIEAMHAAPGNRPRLMLMFFTGNSVHRWAKGKTQTARDLKLLEEQLPRGIACIIMTTVPTYRPIDNRFRKQAQAGLAAAIKATGSRCRFVPGYTTRSVAAFQGKPQYYRRHRSGKVKDPYHPNENGATTFLRLRREALCTAALESLRPMALAQRELSKASARLEAPEANSMDAMRDGQY